MAGILQEFLVQKINAEHPQLCEQLQGKYQDAATEMADQYQKAYFLPNPKQKLDQRYRNQEKASEYINSNKSFGF